MGLKQSSVLSVFAFLSFLVLGVLAIVLFKTQYSRATVRPDDTVKISQAQDDSVQLKLSQTWESYKTRFLEPDGRTIDRGRANLTTSEGQAYTLLRAAWMSDRATFDKTLAWTNHNLSGRNDSLFATMWGQDNAGRWTILDNTSSSRAGQDIAYALLLAAKRWPGNENYQKQAQAILNDLWRKTVITIGGKPYLTAGDWAVSQSRPTLNPSYYAPYAYRAFAHFDSNPAHAWPALTATSFEAVYGCAALNEPSRLLPDWCAIAPSTGAYELPSANLSASYGYQAFQGYWRLALDDQWYGAKDRRSREFLQWSSAGRNPLLTATTLAARYDASGNAIAPEDSSTYAGALGLRLGVDPVAAQNLYGKMLGTYHELDKGAYYFWDEPENYYQQNWLWFGLALYNRTLEPV